ncbi:hypothetical protein B0H34DRAFT_423966 [Crassisporium funariophilum]|nr:hypothetical protein B0H34DRAFT_423966 [Crassisporium funariophilum]
MKLSVLSFAITFASFMQASAMPNPQTTTPVYHCGGNANAKCPIGYRCCGPISVELGGTCYLGVRGICPL